MSFAIGVLAGLAAGVVGAARRARACSPRPGSARPPAARDQIVEEAQRDAEATRREAQIEAREAAVRARAEIEQEVADRRERAAKIEERALARQEELDRKLHGAERREQGVADREAHARKLQEELKQAKRRSSAELERIAGMTHAGGEGGCARARSEELVRHELARRVRQAEEEARAEAKRRARNLVADALQRVAASHAAETTVTVVELPSDDMKGRIIGREGRNIRALEHLTGVDFIIDDTPHAVVLSSFDGIRREIARLTLHEADRGRPHPPGADRGDVLPVEGRARGARPPGRRAGRLRGELRRLPRGARRRSSAGCATARATGRTCSSTRSRSCSSPG